MARPITFIDEADPLGPPADSATATALSAENLNALQDGLIPVDGIGADEVPVGTSDPTVWKARKLRYRNMADSEWGLDLTGATDNTTALTALVTASHGMKLYLPGGNTVQGNFILPDASNITVEGDGEGSVLKLPTGVVNGLDLGNGCRARGLYIDGNKSGSNTGRAVVATSAHDIVEEWLWVVNAGNDAVQVTNCYDITLDHITVTNPEGMGITFNLNASAAVDATGISLSHINVDRSGSTDNTKDGVSFANSSSTYRFLGTDIDHFHIKRASAGAICLEMAYPQKARIAHGFTEGGTEGVSLAQGDYCSVEDVAPIGATSIGIELAGCFDTTVRGCPINGGGTTTTGISVNDASGNRQSARVILEANPIKDCATNAIKLFRTQSAQAIGNSILHEANDYAVLLQGGGPIEMHALLSDNHINCNSLGSGIKTVNGPIHLEGANNKIRDYQFIGILYAGATDGAFGPNQISSSVSGAVKISVTSGITGLQERTARNEVVTLTDGATVSVGWGGYFKLSAGGSRTIAAPSWPTTGERITFDILNNTAGAITTTWNSIYKLAGTWTDPATTKRRTITFAYDGTSWIEQNRSAGDI